MKLLIIQPRISYFSGGGELMPLDMIVALLDEICVESICLVTTNPISGYSEKYSNFKINGSKNSKLSIIELEVPKKYHPIYQINPGEDRSRWDLESMMFVKLMNSTKIDFSKYTHSVSFYILDGLAIPESITNIIYLLGYPKDKNELRPILLSSYDVILANSLNVVEMWHKDMTKNQYEKSRVLLQGLEFRPTEQLTDVKKYDTKMINIVYTGRIIERKGIFDLVEAVNLLRQKYNNLLLHIYGDGTAMDALVSIIKQLNLEEFVKVHGFDANIVSKLPYADICCFPSQGKEGLMSAVLEAMYYNGLVITTTQNGSESVIEDNISGFLIEPQKPNILASKIDSVLKLSNTEINKIKNNARASIITKCRWESFTREFIYILEQYNRHK